jgi:hypothetical protein
VTLFATFVTLFLGCADTGGGTKECEIFSRDLTEECPDGLVEEDADDIDNLLCCPDDTGT